LWRDCRKGQIEVEINVVTITTAVAVVGFALVEGGCEE
jgi:hypothetical protein